MKRLLLLCALLLLPGCARDRSPQGAPHETAPPQVTEADYALQTVTAHYQALENDDKPGFEATCFPSSSTSFWWTTGRRYATRYGVRWEYHHTEAQPNGDYKIFFRRIQADGSQRGSPVPCTVKSENGRWLVYASTQ